jgi:hypothetical protein
MTETINKDHLPTTEAVLQYLQERLANYISKLTSLLDAARDTLDQYNEDTGAGPVDRANDLIHFAVHQPDDIRAANKELGKVILTRRVAQ